MSAKHWGIAILFFLGLLSWIVIVVAYWLHAIDPPRWLIGIAFSYVLIDLLFILIRMANDHA